MASEYTTILATDSALTIRRKKAIASLEGQKEYSGVWTDKEEKKLQTLKDELDTGQILPTLPGAGDETKRDGWIKNLLRSIFGAKAAGASTLYPEGGIGNYLPGQSIYPAGMSGAAWLQQQQPTPAQQLAEIMAAGQQALGQTQPQIAAQQAASQATQQGNYQAPTMTQQQMVQEAQQTAGTVNPHEATQAAYSSPRPSRPIRGPHGAQGGLVSINHITRRL